MSKSVVQGSCLCGTVQFQFSVTSGAFEICHCNRCRKKSGSNALPMITVKSSDLKFISGKDSIQTYQAPILYSKPAYESHFCKKCGCQTPSPSPHDDIVEVPAGSLDSDPCIKPDKHIFVEFAPEWDTIHDQLPRFRIEDLHRLRYGSELPKSFKLKSHYD